MQHSTGSKKGGRERQPKPKRRSWGPFERNNDLCLRDTGKKVGVKNSLASPTSLCHTSYLLPTAQIQQEAREYGSHRCDPYSWDSQDRACRWWKRRDKQEAAGTEVKCDCERAKSSSTTVSQFSKLMNQKIVLYGYYWAAQKQIPQEIVGNEHSWRRYCMRKVQRRKKFKE